MSMFSEGELCLLIGAIILVLVLLFIGVLIFSISVACVVLKSHALKDEMRSTDDVLDRSIPPYREQPRSGVRLAHQPEKIEIEEPTFSPASKPRQTVEEIIEFIDSEDVREIVRDRESEIVRRLEDWASEVADTIDEISRMLPEAGISTYLEHLRSQLEALDCTLIDSDKWDPDLQRAVKVEDTTTPGSTPLIVRKISIGLRVRGKLVRKQSVIIEK